MTLNLPFGIRVRGAIRPPAVGSHLAVPSLRHQLAVIRPLHGEGVEGKTSEKASVFSALIGFDSNWTDGALTC